MNLEEREKKRISGWNKGDDDKTERKEKWEEEMVAASLTSSLYRSLIPGRFGKWADCSDVNKRTCITLSFSHTDTYIQTQARL